MKATAKWVYETVYSLSVVAGQRELYKSRKQHEISPEHNSFGEADVEGTEQTAGNQHDWDVQTDDSVM